MKISSQNNATAGKSLDPTEQKSNNDEAVNPFITMLLQMLIHPEESKKIAATSHDSQQTNQQAKSPLNSAKPVTGLHPIQNQSTSKIESLLNTQTNAESLKTAEKISVAPHEAPQQQPEIENKNLADTLKNLLAQQDKPEVKLEVPKKSLAESIQPPSSQPHTQPLEVHITRVKQETTEKQTPVVIKQNFNEIANTLQTVVTQHIQHVAEQPHTNIEFNDIIAKASAPQERAPTEPMVSIEHPIVNDKNNEYKAWIQIHPPELGRILATLKVTGNTAEITLHTSNATARNILHADMPVIQESLQKADIQVKHIQVEQFTTQSQTGNQHNDRSHSQKNQFTDNELPQQPINVKQSRVEKEIDPNSTVDTYV